MINKKEFDLLLKEIFQIENKIEEMKILKQFEDASKYNKELDSIKEKAKDIIVDDNGNQAEFDDISLEVFLDLIKLNVEVDYFVLKANGTIASVSESKIDAEAVKKVKKLWEKLEMELEEWNKESHNPLNEIEHNKEIGKITLDIILCKLQIEAIIDFTEVFKYCKKDFLINAIKEVLYDGAKVEKDEIKRNLLIDWAKKMDEKELYNYKLWQEILMIKNIRSRDDHIEIIGNILERDTRKYEIEDNSKKKIDKKDLDVYDDEISIFESIKNYFKKLRQRTAQNNMMLTWGTVYGPAFKAELVDETVKYAKENLDKDIIENVKKLTIATDGVAKYYFEKNAKFKELEEISFFSSGVNSGVSLTPDRTYRCIGAETFADCKKLKKVDFGLIEVISEGAFKDCKKLSTITFSPCLKHIGENAFLNCEGITKVEFLGELSLVILDRPQNILNCFKGTNLEEIVFPNLDLARNFAITDCPNLKRILISNIPGVEIPFKVCKYRLGRQEGIVAFSREEALSLWKRKNSTIRFFELTNEEKKSINFK